MTREAALREWWDGLLPHARANAGTAALGGADLPDGLLRSLVEAGVIVVSDGYFDHRFKPNDGFPMPADMCRFIFTQQHTGLPRSRSAAGTTGR